MLTCTVLLALLMLIGAGCNDDSRPVTVSQPEGLESALPGVYDTTPESTNNLVRDASARLKDTLTTGKGVHFVIDATTTSGATTVVSRGEGDMVFPDRIHMTLQNFTGNVSTPTEVISIGSKVYIRSTTTNATWHSTTGGSTTPDPDSLTRMLDFARSSTAFGQESLKGDRTTYHVQLDIDASMLADEALKKTSDPTQTQAIEATRNSTVTVDLWIGTNDLQIYQEKVTTSNPALNLTSYQTFIFSDWGKVVEINKPCEAC